MPPKKVKQTENESKKKAKPEIKSKIQKPSKVLKKKVSQDFEENESIIDDESASVSSKQSDNKKGLADKYKKLEPREHVLKRPGMYIGSIEKDVYNTWVYDPEEEKIVRKPVTLVIGLYKIFDEILVNTIDHVTRMEEKIKDRERESGSSKSKKSDEDDQPLFPVKTIKINIDKKSGEISIFNDGNGIDVIMHPEYKIYIPELIFGNLLTSTNYDDNEIKNIGGQNGIGAKACNIFSKTFTIETCDGHYNYTQDFHDNMSVIKKPSIRKCTKKPYTKITFTPDYEAFKLLPDNEDHDILTDDIYYTFVKRSYDICALTKPDVTVWLNNEKLNFKTFEKYVELYWGNKSDKVHVVESNDNWHIAASYTENVGLEQVSFVNGICTFNGGKHVDYIVNQIANKMCDMITKKKKNVEVKPNHVKNYLSVIIKCNIDNPTFDSQSKETLTTPMSKFGSKIDLSEKFIDKLFKSEIMDKILNLCDKNTKALHKKTDGKKQNKIRGLAKLEDANNAGGKESSKCTLIITEGDSAKTLALSGLSVVGRDYYGIYPLRGKLLNVKDVNEMKITANKEIQDLKKILGLESGKKYTNTNDLRYGHILLMADADVDAHHIRGLVMNLFHTLWPSLLSNPDFIISLVTPIVKVTKGKTIHSFYNLTDYRKWFDETNASTTNGVKDWKIKYYKGLGTSNDEEAKEYFKNMHTVHYTYENENKEVDNAFCLLFDKKKANERKEWIGKYKPREEVQIKEQKEYMTYQDFVNHEVILYSRDDLKRSIPSMIDGLKPSQRKILYAAFKRNLTTEAKVSQFSGYVSEHASYHHGEASLQSTIVSMAQDFPGSNNLQLLMPNGMFGSRNQGGHDAAQPRYIFTQLNPLTSKIFRKDDFKLLDYKDDDGFTIEPEFYVPIIPMVLINGALGIGTGYSTNIPCFNPIDIVNALKVCIASKGEIDENTEDTLKPWYRGFTGDIRINDENKDARTYSTHGIYNKLDDSRVEIVELPVGTWTENYKEFLEQYLIDHPDTLKDFESHCSNNVHFILHFNPNELDKLMDTPDKFETEFKLVSKNISLRNMHLFNKDGEICKYNRVSSIIKDFYHVRMDYYEKRRSANIRDLRDQIEKANAKAHFIREVMEKKIDIMGKKREDVNTILAEKEYPMMDGDYNYILRMPIYTFTKEKYDELLKDVDNLNKTLEIYESKSEADLWYEELNIVIEDYKKDYEDYIYRLKGDGSDETEKGKGKGKKKMVTKTKKSAKSS